MTNDSREWSGDRNKKWYRNLGLGDSDSWAHIGEWGTEKLVADLGKEDNMSKVFSFFFFLTFFDLITFPWDLWFSFWVL